MKLFKSLTFLTIALTLFGFSQTSHAWPAWAKKTIEELDAIYHRKLKEMNEEMAGRKEDWLEADSAFETYRGNYRESEKAYKNARSDYQKLVEDFEDLTCVQLPEGHDDANEYLENRYGNFSTQQECEDARTMKKLNVLAEYKALAATKVSLKSDGTELDGLRAEAKKILKLYLDTRAANRTRQLNLKMQLTEDTVKCLGSGGI